LGVDSHASSPLSARRPTIVGVVARRSDNSWLECTGTDFSRMSCFRVASRLDLPRPFSSLRPRVPYTGTVYLYSILGETMLSELATCPLCGADAGRVRSSHLRGYRYSCARCGVFGIEAAALGSKGMLVSAREDVARLRAYGHLPCIQRVRQGFRISAGRA